MEEHVSQPQSPAPAVNPLRMEEYLGNKEPQVSSRKSRVFRRIRKWSAFVFMVCVVGIVGLAAFLFFTPANISGSEQAFSVTKGERIVNIAQHLEQQGIIRNGFSFAVLLRLQGREAQVKSGEFRLSPAMTPRRISDVLTAQAPPEADIAVTIPEGFTESEIAARLHDTGILDDSATFLTANVSVAPYDFLPQCAVAIGVSSCTVAVSSLEGYLFPDTYRFRKHATSDEIAQKFLENFDTRISSSVRGEVETAGRSFSDIVTMASLVEKEAKLDADRATIAGILYKRLELGMPLQVDATVLYAKSKGGSIALATRELTGEDIQIDSPYNTYQHVGLPPGPIANAGLKSLLAALRPESSPYLFYLHTPDGTTIYSRTLQEHNAAKARYLYSP